MQTIQGSIVSIARLNATIWQYILKPQQFVPYQAGQYLQIHWPEGPQYYSIANAPSEGQHYELHVRHRSQMQIWQNEQALTWSLPFGCCDIAHLHPQKPILFLAVGTGFAPIRAMINQLVAQSDARHFELHWRVANEDDLYDKRSLQRWLEQCPHYRFFPFVTPSNQAVWIPTLVQCYPNLKEWQIVMAGPFELMYAMQKELLYYGQDKQSILSDAFEFL